MVIQPIEKEFYIFPYIKIIKVINPLTSQAKKDFDYEWENFYMIEIGIWMFKFIF